jgi:hypothetical protein
LDEMHVLLEASGQCEVHLGLQNTMTRYEAKY